MMNRTNRSVLFTSGIFLALISVQALSVSAQGVPMGETTCYANDGGKMRQVPCPTGGQTNTPTTPTVDNSAAEKAERDRLAREAEDKRLADEAKAKKEAAERQKAFEKSRDEALQTIKGSGGATTLRDINGTGDPGLKGSSTSSGLRDGKQTPAAAPEPVVPKFLETTVANSFPMAPPEVSERIRKGLQAVMNHDWKVARAWFQDAQNREPKDLGIQRLAALADYMVEKKDTPAPVPAETTPADQEKIFKDTMESGMNEFYLEYVLATRS
ncbi:MAG: hypothetical protein IPI64_05800 [Chloracidobacterium sp.]|nr:hypothetical protein [Chloracidobacterium sp.]